MTEADIDAQWQEYKALVGAERDTMERLTKWKQDHSHFMWHFFATEAERLHIPKMRKRPVLDDLTPEEEAELNQKLTKDKRP